MVTDGKGLNTPIAKLIMSVTDVMVIDTAASLSITAIRSGTLLFMDVLLQAANITNVSSMPIPKRVRVRKYLTTNLASYRSLKTVQPDLCL